MNEIKERSSVSELSVEKVIGNPDKEKDAVPYINKFDIPNYQRGYRWTEREVKKLLDDVNEARKRKVEKYCIQPIVVQEEEKYYDNGRQVNKWAVIDGQQRLTTLFLILHSFRKYYTTNENIFDIEYQNRDSSTTELSNFSKKTRDYTYKKFFLDQNVDFPQISFDRLNSNLDVFYFSKAQTAISVWLDNIQTEDEKKDLEQYFRKKVYLLWYEFDKCDGNTTPENLFCRLNMGKIPLTTSELLKAYILKIDQKAIKEEVEEFSDNLYDGDKKAEEKLSKTITNKYIGKQRTMAEQWDEIERGLSDDSFFRFICSSKTEYDNRMDYLFHVIYLVKKMSYNCTTDLSDISIPDRDELFDYYENQILTNQNRNRPYVLELWESVRDLYLLLQEWYNDNITFHKIGFIISCNETNSALILSKIRYMYNNCKSKEEFKGYRSNIDASIKQGMLDEEIRRILAELLTKNIEDKDIEPETIDIGELTYTDSKDKDKIKKILLLFNVISAMNSSDYKFAFEKILPLDKRASLEHIFPQSSDIIDIDRKGEIKDFEKSVRAELNSKGFDLSTINKLSQNPNKEELEKWWDEILSAFFGNELNIVHSIGNLALISGNLNAGLSNNMFADKQKTIKKYDKDGKYIPICTHNVFLKYYSENNSTTAIWTKDDINDHSKSIKEIVRDYLPSGQ